MITPTERYGGYLLGPLGYSLVSFFLASYLNVYYTDVCGLNSLWGGRFMSLYPVAVKLLSVFTFLGAGFLIDRTRSRWGKARPWLLLSALLVPISAFLLFLVPTGSETLVALWVLGSNFLFHAVAATLYATANTLMIPLSTANADERSSLAVTANAQTLISGGAVALLAPMVLLPFMGVEPSRWLATGAVLCGLAAPLLFWQFAATRERVSSRQRDQASLRSQLRACARSRRWVLLMAYFLLTNLVTQLSNASVFYYCNWVLGDYQDGVTQALFYAIGNAPLGVGVFLCNPLCRRLGRRNAMCGGLMLSALGLLLCLLFPKNLPVVLAGQFIKACGAIPATYLASVLLGDALDDVEKRSHRRCDGFSSSLYNAMITVASGISVSLLNGGMAALGYLPPTAAAIPAQPEAVQFFFTLCQMGVGMAAYPVLAWLLWRQQSQHEAFSS